MKTKYGMTMLALAVLASLLVATAQGGAKAPKKTDSMVWDFEQASAGQIPAGWKVEATNEKGNPAIWSVVKDATAPSGEKVLALASPNPNFGDTFNLCWIDDLSFLDGEIKVCFKAATGEEDQGGGVIWRAQDKNNYYIARFNPLEDNFRIYTVQNARRKMLASAKIALGPGWHTLRIVQQGKQFEGYLDGQKRLEGSTGLFPEPGGAGLWTKADAATLFDDFSVVPK